MSQISKKAGYFYLFSLFLIFSSIMPAQIDERQIEQEVIEFDGRRDLVADLGAIYQDDIAVSICSMRAVTEPLFYRLDGEWKEIPIGIRSLGRWFPLRGSRTLRLHLQIVAEDGSKSIDLNPSIEIVLPRASQDYLIILPNQTTPMQSSLVFPFCEEAFALGSSMMVNLTGINLIFKVDDKVHSVGPGNHWVVPVVLHGENLRRIDIRVGAVSEEDASVIYSSETPFVRESRLFHAFYVSKDREMGTYLAALSARDMGPPRRQVRTGN